LVNSNKVLNTLQICYSDPTLHTLPVVVNSYYPCCPIPPSYSNNFLDIF